DHRADIYAVGVMLYQMLTGKIPQGMFKLPSLIVPGLDPRYDAIVRKALMEDREARYQSIREMRVELDSILTQPVAKVEPAASAADAKAAALPTGARPQRPGGRPVMRPAAAPSAAQPPQRGSLAWLWVTALILAVLGGVAWMILHGNKPQIVQHRDAPATSEAASPPQAVIATTSVPKASEGITPPQVPLKSLPATTTVSTSTPSEPGWTSLFNGKDLTGWELHPSNFPADVQDGAIRIRGSSTIPVSGNMYYRGTGGTLPQWTDFEVICTVKTENKGNSGIFLHASPGAPDKNRANGIEVQVWNDTSKGTTGLTGSLQRVASTTTARIRDGEWFQIKTRVEGRRVQTWLKKADETDWQPAVDWTQPAQWQPPRDRPGIKLGSGTISLQNNPPLDGVAWIKDIQFRVLNAPPAQTTAVTSAPSTLPAPEPEILEFTSADSVGGWSFISTSGTSWPEVDAVGQGHAILESTDETLHPNNNLSAPRLLRDVTGDFTLETWLDFSGGGSNKFAGSGLLLWHDEMNFIRLERIYADWQTSRHGISLQGRINGVYKYWVNTDTIPTQVTHNRLRLTRKGGEITAYWLDSAQNWLQVGTVAVSWPAKLQAGIVTTALRGGPVVRTRFDRVTLTTATPASPLTTVTPASLGETFNGHRYQFVPGALTWKEAKAKAESMGGHLATLTSKEENEWLLLTYRKLLTTQNRNIWLGAMEEMAGLGWKWVTGEPFTPLGWFPGEPNGMRGGGGQVGHPFMLNLYSFKDGAVGWNDSSTHFSQSRDNIGFIVEWDAETPSAMAASAEEGFVPLFQNDSLSGWTGDLSSYQMRNGILSGGNGNLVNPKEYGDFSLRFDLRLAAGAYVEMSIRGQTPPQPNRGAPNASFGVVLRDNTEASAAALEPWKRHGAIYGYQEALRMEGGSPGRWNEHEIRVENQHLTVTINGVTVQDTDLSKLTRKAPGGRSLDLSRTSGQIAILGFKGTTEFRNVRIKELGVTSVSATSPVPNPTMGASATTWIDTKGRSLQAKFVRIEGANVLLDIADKVTPVALATLSTASQDMARQLAASMQASVGTANSSALDPEAGFISLLEAGKPGDWVQVGPGTMNIQNGVSTNRSPTKWGVAIYAKRSFTNFILKAEFKGMSTQFNSGVWLRITDPRADITQVGDSRYEVGICDFRNDLRRATGAIWGVQPALKDALKLNDWNELEITVTGHRHVVKLNGQLVNDFTGNKNLTGYIGLEENGEPGGGPVQFRNVRIKPLP
ncbi:MAG TPA: hypothetical protein DDZ88_16625, partial [Verrucomicrobiales bacterium]|nr:hypothetical protein [Verrucomicrobiales bacterium]